MIINKFRKMVKAQQPETTELDLICVGLTLSGIVFTSGAAAFSHYEGKTTTKVITMYTAKRILERFGIQTLSLFVKI